jgi:hypothetical protein
MHEEGLVGAIQLSTYGSVSHILVRHTQQVAFSYGLVLLVASPIGCLNIRSTVFTWIS